MAAVNLGTACKISFGSFAYTGYLPEDGLTWGKAAGNIEEITDEDGDMFAKIVMGPGDQLSGSFVIKDSGGSVTPPIDGATVTVTDPANVELKGMSQGSTVVFSRGVSKLNLNMVKETGIVYA